MKGSSIAMSKTPIKLTETYTYRNWYVLYCGVGLTVMPGLCVAYGVVFLLRALMALEPDFWEALLFLHLPGALFILGLRLLLAFVWERIVIDADSILWIDHLGRPHGPFRLDAIRSVRRGIVSLGLGGTYEVKLDGGYVKFASAAINNVDILVERLGGESRSWL